MIGERRAIRIHAQPRLKQDNGLLAGLVLQQEDRPVLRRKRPSPRNAIRLRIEGRRQAQQRHERVHEIALQSHGFSSDGGNTLITA
jgi:hypothetical protein